ncbi:hypothetical protein FD04_GL002340 [Secundilactobacillus odoratitofui DSM 19909 = JCM 15043]|uniref:Septum formation initiator n=1 Tax=Secundilactobacillus odoratitofui DSM 19909 = JCM 15043 TaxID=1423776 RepID=A0A0R1LUE8_9LACO|nr:septum formation initiator family protein [Secundilactobacillus odoratitofui]KRK99350.1 hypothetical protein FD04_GL002340 [Secundilactobacillus odoratitofui DSM 19909 = JCM 15043]
MAKQAKITRLDNQYTRQVQQREEQRQSKSVLTKIRKRRAVMIISCFFIVFAVLGIQIFQARASVHKTDAAIAQRQERLTKVKATHQQLNEHVKLLNDKSYLENLIRSKYYYGKSGETIYSLPGDKSSDVTAK